MSMSDLDTSTDNTDRAGSGRERKLAALRPYQWAKGTSGNWAGPKPGTGRKQLQAKFINDLRDDWAEHGASVLAEVRRTKPDQYLKCVTALMPRLMDISVGVTSELSDEQLTDCIDTILRLRQQQAAKLIEVNPADAPPEANR
jgi:hypothetical protein